MKNHSFFKLSSILTFLIIAISCNSDQKSMNNEKVNVSTKKLYNEDLRPQFHFSPKENWTNDPNGMVYYKGTYHLFFQHNPVGINWGNMTWGHSVSSDMVHWEELEDAIVPDELGTIFSGTATVDWNNSAGFQVGDEKTIVASYTYCGSCEQFGDPGPDEPFTQAIAYSTDGGKTFTKYSGNPVLENIAGGGDRDPKVFWHEPTQKWVMLLYLDYKTDDFWTHRNWRFAFFNSDDMKNWKKVSEMEDIEMFECPEIFELAIDGDENNKKWVIYGASGDYLIGNFDGKKFTRESGRFRGDFGPNFYASQTYNDIPKSDGRRIQIGWMRDGEYPSMPFNQQMTFPVVLTLKTTDDGIRMFKEPIKEIESIYTSNSLSLINKIVKPNENILEGFKASLLDVEVIVEPRGASDFGFTTNELTIRYYVDEGVLASGNRSYQKHTAPLKLDNGTVKLRLLIDRSSLEVFGNDGRVTLSSNYNGSDSVEENNMNLRFYSNDGEVLIKSLKIHELKSIWSAENKSNFYDQKGINSETKLKPEIN